MSNRFIFGVFACLLAGSAARAAQPEAGERFYQAIRANDMAALRQLLQTGDANVRARQGVTPLMNAAAFGSMEAMEILLGRGADVNARDAFDTTALMRSTRDVEKVRLLLSRGADVQVRSKQGRSALLIAAAIPGSAPVVRMLLEKGAKVSGADSMGMTVLSVAVDANDATTVKLLLEHGAGIEGRNLVGASPLLSAAANGNVELMRLLMARGAKVNETSPPSWGPNVKNGPIALGLLTPLHVAAPYGPADAVKLLLDAGAAVNARDVRGMTPLMLAVATDRANERIVRLLVERGADPSIRDNYGQSSVDWARKYNRGSILAVLGQRPSRTGEKFAVVPTSASKAVDLRVAVESGAGLLAQSSKEFFKAGGCVSCHSQNITAQALFTARDHGVTIDMATAAEQAKAARLFWVSMEPMLIQGASGPAGPDGIVYNMLHLAAGGAAQDYTTDALLYALAALQTPAGNWHFGGVARAPIMDGDFARTALAIRAFKVFGTPARRAEFESRIASAGAWLRKAAPVTTEDHVMRALGLYWAGEDRAAVAAEVRKLIAMERPDGGWAQIPSLASDAYATGEALYALHELGVLTSDPAYRRGVAYLLRTQQSDGSWLVKSRAPKIQPYFQSGFPYDHDQWISASGTAWAVTGLSLALPETPFTAGLR